MLKLKVGDIAPDFSSEDHLGKTICLKDLKGSKVILYFYPKDSTPTCTVEACNLRDNYQLLSKKGYVVLGVSADSQKRHKSFADKQNLPFSLLMDEDKKIINDYGVWGPKKFMGRTFNGIHRVTFVIDEQSKIAAIIDKVTAKSHSEQILEIMEN